MSSALYSSQLRHELSVLNRAYAARVGLAACESYGEAPVVCYLPSEDGLAHGNFLADAYRAILNNPSWRKRLAKVHSQARTALPRNGHAWRELDSSNSSDALLMNIFCFPGVPQHAATVLGIEVEQQPEFGVRARVPLINGRFDRTEVDMRVGDLLVEAKLTEADFQSRECAQLETYRDFADVFDRRTLPRADGRYLGYQLIRNVLAAQANGCSFCVMSDARRPDLREQWYAVIRAVKLVDLRTRCKMMTWQELAPVLPRKLRDFLRLKYGIAE